MDALNMRWKIRKKGEENNEKKLYVNSYKF